MAYREFILYDARAGTDKASVVEAGLASSKEAEKAARDHGFQVACYSYTEKGGELTDERHEWDSDARGAKVKTKRRGKIGPSAPPKGVTLPLLPMSALPRRGKKGDEIVVVGDEVSECFRWYGGEWSGDPFPLFHEARGPWLHEAKGWFFIRQG